MTIDELIARLEAATGPNRKLDSEICRAAGWEVRADKKFGGDYYQPRKNYTWQDVPAYTASIDAALTLVPEGWSVQSLSQSLDLTWWDCTLERVCCEDGLFLGSGVEVTADARPSLPLALCIAALKARTPRGTEG